MGNETISNSISMPRRWLVYLVLLGIGMGHVYCQWRRIDVWPFSNYAMYSRPYGESWTNHQFVAVSADVPPQEVIIPIKSLPRPISVVASLNRKIEAIEQGKADRAELDEVLQWVAMIYQRHCDAMGDEAIPCAAVRLYHQAWTLHRSEAGISVPEPQRTLVAEWISPRGTS